jgi:hypothetical protein
MHLLLVSLAFAKPPPPSLLLPVIPPAEEGKPHYVVWTSLPKGATRGDPWTSDFPPLTCRPDHDGLAIDMVVDTSEWPYQLPSTATCIQGAVRLTIKLGFRDPDVGMWRASDGAIVVPHREGQYLQRTWDEQGAWTAARLDPPTEGIACEVNAAGALVVKADGNAPPGEAVCKATRADGSTSDQRVVVLRY